MDNVEEFVLNEIENNHLIFNEVKSPLKEKKDFIIKAIKRNKEVVELAKEIISKNRDLALWSISQGYLILDDLSDELRDDEEVVLEYIFSINQKKDKFLLTKNMWEFAVCSSQRITNFIYKNADKKTKMDVVYSLESLIEKNRIFNAINTKDFKNSYKKRL